MRKTVSGIMLTLLMLSMLTLAINIQPVKASGTIYIRADGSIDPPDAPISTVDNVTYTLTGNITSDADGIVIERSNVLIDGAGYTVEGTGNGKGFYLSGITNVTIQNANIKRFLCGISLESSSNNSISGNNITNNGVGILLWNSLNNSMVGNNITNNRYYGIYLLYSSNNNSIAENNVTANNGYGIFLDSSSNNSMVGNNVTANNQDGILLWNSLNNSIAENNVTNNEYGIELYDSSNNSVSGNNVANNWWGMSLGASSNTTLRDNGMADNRYNFGVYGVALSKFVNDVDVSNTVNGKPVYYLIGEKDLVVDPTTFPQVGYLALVNCTGITVQGLSLSNNSQGILLAYTQNSTITNNTIANNWHRIWLRESLNNRFYHNNFIDNTQQVYSDGYANVWDDGYPSGGNYWSDYTGIDVYRGPHQNVTGSDGIGDTPYVIDTNNRDNYPLMKPYPWDSHDIGITYIGKVWEIYFPPIVPLKTVVGLGLGLHINVFVMNYGDYSEVFNVTVYANTTAIHTITNITLASRNSIILNFTWNTSGFAKGNYTIWAYASPVADETDKADNTLPDGWVIIAMVGDVTGPDGWPDGTCDMLYDIRSVAKLFGAVYPDPQYVANYDINGDGQIDMLNDIRTVAKQFGKTDP